MRFLCDQMLFKLAKWLRAAGYDTALVRAGLSDEEVEKQAIEEGRILLTRDRSLALKNSSFIFITSDNLEECIEELKKLSIDWTFKPLTRCLVCNEILVPGTEVPRANGPFTFCPKCKRTYWFGSHAERMLETLKSWNL